MYVRVVAYKMSRLSAARRRAVHAHLGETSPLCLSHPYANLARRSQSENRETRAACRASRAARLDLTRVSNSGSHRVIVLLVDVKRHERIRARHVLASTRFYSVIVANATERERRRESGGKRREKA